MPEESRDPNEGERCTPGERNWDCIKEVSCTECEFDATMMMIKNKTGESGWSDYMINKMRFLRASHKKQHKNHQLAKQKSPIQIAGISSPGWRLCNDLWAPHWLTEQRMTIWREDWIEDQKVNYLTTAMWINFPAWKLHDYDDPNWRMETGIMIIIIIYNLPSIDFNKIC